MLYQFQSYRFEPCSYPSSMNGIYENGLNISAEDSMGELDEIDFDHVRCEWRDVFERRVLQKSPCSNFDKRFVRKLPSLVIYESDKIVAKGQTNDWTHLNSNYALRSTDEISTTQLFFGNIKKSWKMRGAINENRNKFSRSTSSASQRHDKMEIQTTAVAAKCAVDRK